MDIRNIRNKAAVIAGHARHLLQAAGELPQIIAADPDIDLTEAAAGIATDLNNATYSIDVARSFIDKVATSLATPRTRSKKAAPKETEKS